MVRACGCPAGSRRGLKGDEGGQGKNNGSDGKERDEKSSSCKKEKNFEKARVLKRVLAWQEREKGKLINGVRPRSTPGVIFRKEGKGGKPGGHVVEGGKGQRSRLGGERNDAPENVCPLSDTRER